QVQRYHMALSNSTARLLSCPSESPLCHSAVELPDKSLSATQDGLMRNRYLGKAARPSQNQIRLRCNCLSQSTHCPALRSPPHFLVRFESPDHNRQSPCRIARALCRLGLYH